jgi:prevent-host-death family protein
MTIDMPKTIQSISEAKAHFSAIVDDASGGQTFIICRAGRPIVVLSKYVPPVRKRRPDSLKGKIRMADDFDELPEGFAEAFS